MHVLELEYQFDMAVEALFSRWTKADHLKRWMCPNPGEILSCQLNLRVGGRYTIAMQTQSGPHTVTGTYLEIVQNRRLRFTWGWMGNNWSNEVDVQFFSTDSGGSRLTLRQREFPSCDDLEQHRDGWNMCVANIETDAEAAQ